MSHRLLRVVLLAFTAACGTSDPLEPGPDSAIDAGKPETDASTEPVPIIRTMSVTIPPTGETVGFEVRDFRGTDYVTTVTANRPPAKLRLIRSSLFQTTHPGFLGPGTLAEKCATFDGATFPHASYAGLEWGTFGFDTEYGPNTDALKAAIRAELDRNGWLPEGNRYNYSWPGALWPNVEGRLEFLAGARSPTVTVGTTTVAAIGEQAFAGMFSFLARTGGSGGASLPIGVVCDLANGKAIVRAKVTSTPPIALELVLIP